MILTEPIRWVKTVEVLYGIMSNSELLSKLVPILADIFVFTYPVYLLTVYGLLFSLDQIHHTAIGVAN
jgi:hypothetical protein